MTFEVARHELALQQFAQAWINSLDRTASNGVINPIDRLLSSDPDNKGEDYFGDRVLIFPELWVLYRVKRDPKRVEVLQTGIPGRNLPHDDLE